MRARQLGEVTDPTGVVGNRSLHMHGHPVGVPVQAAALVAGGHVGEPVGRLEGELPEDLHRGVSSHSWGWSIRSLGRWRSRRL